MNAFSFFHQSERAATAGQRGVRVATVASAVLLALAVTACNNQSGAANSTAAQPQQQAAQQPASAAIGAAQVAETPKQDTKPVDTGPGNDTADDNGETALMRAVKAGNTEGVQKLIEAGSNVNYAVPKLGLTSLMYAVNNGNTELAKYLLEKGANVNASLLSGLENSSLHRLYEKGDHKKTGVMQDWELNTFVKWTPLFFAVANGDAGMVRALLDAGADTNHALEDGETALMLAAGNLKNSAEIVRLLKEKGADINAAQSNGATAFSNAVEAGDRELIDYLLESGAKFDADRTFEIALTQYGEPSEYWFGIMKRMLASGANANGIVQSNTFSIDYAQCMAPGVPVLIAAVACGYPDVAQLLIDAKANVNATVESGDLFRSLNAMNIAAERKGALAEHSDKATNTQRAQTAKKLVQILEAAGAHK